MAAEATPNVSSSPLILAVETSSRIGSVAIALGGQMLAESQFSPAPMRHPAPHRRVGLGAPANGPAPASCCRKTAAGAPSSGEGPCAKQPIGTGLRHSAEIFPAIRGLLDRFGRKAAEVEHVYISGGPGSFTGLRIAATLAKIMHLANGARIVAVDTLDVIAANVVSLTNTQGSDSRFSKVAGFPEGGMADVQEAIPKLRLRMPPIGTRQSSIIGRIAAVLDAKRGQFFIAVYQRQETEGQVWRGRPGLGHEGVPPSKHGQDARATTRAGCPRYESIWRKVLPDSLMTIAEFLARFARGEEPVWLLGDGLVYYKDKFETDGVRFFDQEHWSPRARNVHLLGWEMACKGQFAEPLTLTPTYLRKPDVIIKPR